MYPPLVRLFKIELCLQNSSLEEKVIASEYLTIQDLSNYTKEEFYFPTFGPRYIDLYDKPDNCRIRKNIEDDLCDELIIDNDQLNPDYNKDRSERSTYTSIKPANYIARLLISVESQEIPSQKKSNNLNLSLSNSFRDKSEFDLGLTKFESIDLNSFKKDFVAFAIISECSMIDKRFKNGEISFQLCLGKKSLS